MELQAVGWTWGVGGGDSRRMWDLCHLVQVGILVVGECMPLISTC